MTDNKAQAAPQTVAPQTAAQTMQRPTDFFSADEIRYLREISPWRSAFAIAHCWAVIIGTWVLVSMFPNPLTITLGIMIIGARQLGLFVLTPRRRPWRAVREPQGQRLGL